MTGTACRCGCACDTARRRGSAYCRLCARPAHRDDISWAVSVSGLDRAAIMDASGPNGIATAAEIRRRKMTRNVPGQPPGGGEG